MSFRKKYLKFGSNLANYTIWDIFKDYSIMNVFWYLQDGRAVLMFENCIKSEKKLNRIKPSQIAQLLRDLRPF